MQRNYINEIKENLISLGDIPVEERTEEICLAAVQEDGLALEFVPEHKRKKHICLEAVKQSGWALEYVPIKKRTNQICLEAVKDNGMALQFVPDKKRSEEICFIAVQEIGWALQYVPEEKRTEVICLVAVKKKGIALQFVPPKKRTQTVCFTAVQEDGEALQYVPKDFNDEIYGSICLAALRQNGLALRHIPEVRITESMYLAAVQQNAEALQYVPEKMKETIINQLSVKEILANNYLAIYHFPKQHSYHDEINSFLSTVSHILINKSRTDHELRDIELTYAEKKSGVTVCIPTNKNIKQDLDKLLTDMHEADNDHALHLVLIGHANEDSEELAGFDSEGIVDVCKSHSSIKHIKLLGCNVAKANRTEKEDKMLELLSEEIVIKENKKRDIRYGLITTHQAELSKKEFQHTCAQFCQTNKLNGVYVINKIDNQHYQLQIIKYNKNDMGVNIKTISIPENRVRNLNKILERQRKPLSFPTQPGNEYMPVRKKENPLSQKELSALSTVKYQPDRFDKTHPKYKNDKQFYSFLNTINVSMEELQPSLLQRMAKAIEESTDISEDITLKGPTKALHVDTEKRGFVIARTHLYPSTYVHSHFYSRHRNINYDKLNEERRKEMEAMQQGKLSNQTRAKRIRVVVRKNKA